MTQPTENPACPEHAIYMVPHEFQTWEINRPVERGFRCVNLICAIIYIEGDDEGLEAAQSLDAATTRVNALAGECSRRLHDLQPAHGQEDSVHGARRYKA